MQNFELELKSTISDTYRAKKAAHSVDLNSDEKAYHRISISKIDIETPYNVGLIVGASGSGKTTLAKDLFNADLDLSVNNDVAIIDQFQADLSYSEIAKLLNSVELSQIPCWIKPAGHLSNGQKERAKIALALSTDKDLHCFDEWTSVVDRNVASIMSHSVQKLARKTDKKIVLISCHYDVLDWLNPDWVIDCNTQTFIDRRDIVSTFDRKKNCILQSENATKKHGSSLASITI